MPRIVLRDYYFSRTRWATLNEVSESIRVAILLEFSRRKRNLVRDATIFRQFQCWAELQIKQYTRELFSCLSRVSFWMNTSKTAKEGRKMFPRLRKFTSRCTCAPPCYYTLGGKSSKVCARATPFLLHKLCIFHCGVFWIWVDMLIHHFDTRK